jgi:hypothetical protein
MPNILDHSNFNQTELRNVALQNLATAPTSPAPIRGQVYFDTTLNKQGTYNGTVWNYTDAGSVVSVGGTGAIVSSGGQNPVISIVPASGATAGSMSISDYVKLGASTASNIASAIVQRDSSGNFAAGTVTASLTGTATNASALNAQAAAYYLARANHTGTQTSGSISDFDAQVRNSRLDQLAAPTANVGLGSNRITALADPQNSQDAVTKAYADALISTGTNKGTVRAASTANLSLTAPGATIDGVTLVSGDLLLLKDQTTGAQNGLYVWTGAAATLTRTTNANTNAQVRAGLFVFISEGTLNGNNGFTLTTDDPIALGTTALVFAQTSGAGQIVAGAGLTKTGNQIDVGSGTGIIVNADNIQIDPAVVPTKFAQAIGDGVSAAITVTHGLLTRDVSSYKVIRNSSPWDEVMPTVTFPSINTALVTFSSGNIPTANQYRIAIAA